MIIKFVKDIGEIPKGSIAKAFPDEYLDMTLRILTNEQKKELLKLLGKKAEKFFKVRYPKWKLQVPREFVKIPEGALGLYDICSLDGTKKISEKSLSKKEKNFLHNMDKEFMPWKN